jgi:hypothetical protein
VFPLDVEICLYDHPDMKENGSNNVDAEFQTVSIPENNGNVIRVHTNSEHDLFMHPVTNRFYYMNF